MWRPSASSVDPSSPRRPNVANRPSPATAGGRTSGSSTRLTTSDRPRKLRVARTNARGVPRARMNACAISVVLAVTTSASRTAGSPRRLTSSAGGTRRKMASTGSVMNVRPTAAASHMQPVKTRLIDRGAASPLDHHARRLDDPRRRDAGLQPESLDGLAGDDRNDARRLGDIDLDPGEEAVDVHRADDAAKVVPGRERVGGAAAQPVDLRLLDDPPVTRVPQHADLPGPVPATERVEADAERARRLGGCQNLLRHYLSSVAHCLRKCHSPRPSLRGVQATGFSAVTLSRDASRVKRQLSPWRGDAWLRSAGGRSPRLGPGRVPDEGHTAAQPGRGAAQPDPRSGRDAAGSPTVLRGAPALARRGR